MSRLWNALPTSWIRWSRFIWVPTFSGAPPRNRTCFSGDHNHLLCCCRQEVEVMNLYLTLYNAMQCNRIGRGRYCPAWDGTRAFGRTWETLEQNTWFPTETSESDTALVLFCLSIAVVHQFLFSPAISFGVNDLLRVLPGRSMLAFTVRRLHCGCFVEKTSVVFCSRPRCVGRWLNSTFLKRATCRVDYRVWGEIAKQLWWVGDII